MQTMVRLYGLGGGSGGTGAILTVNALAGAVSTDGKSKTKAVDASGLTESKGERNGGAAVTGTASAQNMRALAAMARLTKILTGDIIAILAKYGVVIE